MSFTKVAPAGIGTSPGTSILIGDSLLHSTGIDIGSNTGVGVTIRQHGDATFTGIVTASSFSGSGANLTGIDATAIKHTDGNVKVQATGTGANLTGNLSVSGNLGVGGVLTYEDVTNIDSVGVITARGGIKIGPTAGVAATIFSDGSINTTGIVTATTIKVGTAISITDSAVSATRFHGDGSQLTGISQVGGATGADFNDDTKLRFGGSNQLEVFYGSSKGHVKVTSGQLECISSGNFTAKVSDDETAIHCQSDAQVELYHNGTKQCETSANGLAFPNGKGIDFSATANATVMNEGYSTTAPSTDNELLKTYERGTWTGNIRGYDHAGGAGWGNVATTAGTNQSTGRYIRIGNVVHCWIRFTGITWDTSWTYPSIIGVPFGHNHYDGAGGFCIAQDTNMFTDSTGTVMGNVWGSAGNTVGMKPNGQTNLTFDTSNGNRHMYASMTFYTSTGG
jgi:hypothetical protein